MSFAPAFSYRHSHLHASGLYAIGYIFAAPNGVSMQAVILAAGRGSRMSPLTCTRPKCMVPVAGKPILHHIIDRCTQAGIDDIVVVANYRSADIDTDAVVVLQNSLGTTTDAILSANDLLQDMFIVINGDVISDVGAMTRCGAEPAIAVAGCGHGDEVLVERGCVQQIGGVHTSLYNVGMYVMRRDMLDDIAKQGLLQSLVGASVVEVGEYHHINTPADALDANESLIEHYIDPTVTLLPGVYIEPPVHVGPHSVVGPNSYLRPGTSVGANCRIGQSVEIKNSIIMDNVKIPHLSYVGDSIIGEGCNLGAGTICSNLRHDASPVFGRRKFGVVMRDGYKTTAGSVFMPGAVV